MQSLSKKNRINVATTVEENHIIKLFTSLTNQIVLTKQIYKLHRENGGRLNYIYFKSILPNIINAWILKYSIAELSQHDIYSMDVVSYLNKQFIDNNYHLYEFKSEAVFTVKPDTNPYKLDAMIGYCKDGDDRVNIKPKKYTELLAQDYNQIDVWAEQSTSVSINDSRYNDEIPVWQSSMNIRNYDRDNEGYREGPERSSLGNMLMGYGGAFDSLIKAAEDKYQKNNNIS